MTSAAICDGFIASSGSLLCMLGPSWPVLRRSSSCLRVFVALLSLRRRELHEHICNVLSPGHQKAVGDLVGNVNHVAGPERMPLSTFDAGADVLARGAAGLRVEHLAAEKQRACAALHDDHVDDAVVLLGDRKR